jgi:hypothetical protein
LKQSAAEAVPESSAIARPAGSRSPEQRNGTRDRFLAPPADSLLPFIEMLPTIDWIGQEPDTIGVASNERTQTFAIDLERMVLPEPLALAAAVGENQHLLAEIKSAEQKLSGRESTRNSNRRFCFDPILVNLA